MDTVEFLRHVLPMQGHYVLAYRPRDKQYIAHKTYPTPEAAATGALKLDAKGATVYHACASYVEPSYFCEEKQKQRTRTAKNAGWVRAQWLDIDVAKGEHTYPTRREALEALAAFCRDNALSKPTIIVSGSGLHVYWVFEEDLPKAEALPRMLGFKDALTAAGFKHDPSRTADIASVLRPVGTHHRKSEPPIEVRALHVSEPVSAADFYARFPSAPIRNPAPDDEWSSGVATDYPPSDTKQVAKNCRAIRYFVKRGAVVEEPAWRGVIGVLKHTTDGEAAIHRWSALDPRYSEAQTQEKIDNYTAAPTTCGYIEATELGKACAACPHRGKIKSPISLGYSEDLPPAKKQPVARAADSGPLVDLSCNPNPDTLPFWPKGYAWDGEQLIRWVPAHECKKDEEPRWRPFSPTLYYPFMRYENETAERSVRICALHEPQHNRWRTFEIAASKVSEPQALAYALGAHEVLYMPASKLDNRQYVQDVLYALRSSGVDADTYTSFGWHGRDFVIGNKRLRPDGSVDEVFLSDKIPTHLRGDFGTKGTIEDAARIIDEVYNRPGAEPFQFVILASLGAPLVHLIGSDVAHGLSTALTGESGIAKTMTAAVACALYGDPRKFVIQANEEGTTLRALIGRVGMMRNLPLVMDEITGRDHTEMSSMVFSLANGRAKMRLRSDGTEIDPGMSWATNTFITGNVSITRLLANEDQVKATATQVRCFEIPLTAHYLQTTFSDINAKRVIEHDLLSENYGMIGMKYLRAVVKNQDKIRKQLVAMRSKVQPRNTDETRERFFNDLVATVLVAGQIAQSMGFIKFDLANLKRWADNHIIEMRMSRKTSAHNPYDYMQAFLSKMARHTLITETFSGRGKQARETVIPPDFEMQARNATKDRRMLVTHKAFKDWCRQQHVNEQWLQEAWVAEGLITLNMPRERIGKGTSFYSVPVACLDVNYDLVDSMATPNHLSSVSPEQKKAAPKGGNP